MIFDSTIAGGTHALTVTGPGTFGGAVSGVTNLQVTGDATISTTSITTSGTQAYDGAAKTFVLTAALESTGNKAIRFGGVINPNATGTLGTLSLDTTTVTTLSSSNTLDIDIAGPSHADELTNAAAAGGIFLGGATLNLNVVSSAVGDAFTVVQSTAGGITGTFAGLMNNSLLSTGGHILRVNYSTTAVTLTDVPAVATSLKFLQQPSDTTAGTFISPAVTVEVLDQGGNVFPASAAVNLTATGPASFAAGSMTTVNAANGVASFPGLKLTKAGTYTLTAHSGSLTTAVSNFFHITAAAPASLTLLGGSAVLFKPSTATTGAVRVQILDAFGNPVTGSSVTFSVPVTGATGNFAGNLSTISVLSDASGIATMPTFTTNNSLGSFTILVSLGSLHLNIAATTFFSSITLRV